MKTADPVVCERPPRSLRSRLPLVRGEPPKAAGGRSDTISKDTGVDDERQKERWLGKALGAFAIAQRGHCGWGDMSMLCCCGNVFERISHTHEFAVVPSASEKLNAD